MEEENLICDICGYELRPAFPVSLRHKIADKNDIVRCQRCEAAKGGKAPVFDTSDRTWKAAAR